MIYTMIYVIGNLFKSYERKCEKGAKIAPPPPLGLNRVKIYRTNFLGRIYSTKKK